MPNEDNKILKYNDGGKSMKSSFIIYLECILKKMGISPNNPEKSSTVKINKHAHSVYSLFTYC